MMVLCVGCSKNTSIVGTWETEGEATVLGEGTEAGTMETTMRYTFTENGEGSLEVVYEGAGDAAGKPFQYEVNDGVLTIRYSEKRYEEYKMDLNNNSLTLNGPWYMELTRIE